MIILSNARAGDAAAVPAHEARTMDFRPDAVNHKCYTCPERRKNHACQKSES
jgi:hypothetical protein